MVKDQTAPVDVPAELCATICQKYCWLDDSEPGTYEADAWPVVTCGGGFVMPNFTS